MCTHNIPFSIYKKKITLNYPKSAAMGFFPRAQERVRNSRGKRAISVRATEVLLYSVHQDHFAMLSVSVGIFPAKMIKHARYTACSSVNKVRRRKNYLRIILRKNTLF